MPAWLKSRWVVVPLAITLAVLTWNAYVVVNAGGTVDGRVIDAAGQPVADASVILLERHFVMHNERQRTRTDRGGYFHFTGNDNHSLQLEAEAAGLGRSERRVVRLWFRAQNVRLTEPLRLSTRLP